jgi:putative PIN family toxin of toxin-antitoxin system
VKAVFDTNIFVSALAVPGGRAAAALDRVVSGDVQLVISRPIIHEVLDVLARKFDRDPEELSRVAVFLADLAELVSPRMTIEELADEPDNRILECAVTGRADVIVTGDQTMLKLGEYRGISIVSLRTFLESL